MPTTRATRPSARRRFRAVAYLEKGGCRLASRNGHTYRSFAPLRAAILSEVKARDTILDGEIVCLDAEGRSLFNPLLFRRRRPVFAVFDLLWLNDEDLRGLPLIERKARLRALVPRESPDLLHVDAVPEKGQELFQAACERDLEGVVGKWAQGTYQSDGRATSWVKVRHSTSASIFPARTNLIIPLSLNTKVSFFILSLRWRAMADRVRPGGSSSNSPSRNTSRSQFTSTRPFAVSPRMRGWYGSTFPRLLGVKKYLAFAAPNRSLRRAETLARTGRRYVRPSR